MNPGAGQGRALVTGGAGFVGGHLTERLVESGWSVRVLDDFSSGSEANLAAVRDGVDVVRGDVRDDDVVAKAVEGARAVFHLAARPSVAHTVEDPVGTHSVNAEGTLRVLEAARRAGVQRVVFASSCAVYGACEELPLCESATLDLLSPYAVQKRSGELHCELYTRLYGLECAALRFFNIFGPRQDPASDYAAVIPRFVAKALAGEPPRIFGDGEQTRDFVYVGDVADAITKAAAAERVPPGPLNVASGVRTSVNELWRGVCREVGCDLEARSAAARPGEVPHSHAAIAEARSWLGWAPTVDLAEGLRRTVEHLRGAEA